MHDDFEAGLEITFGVSVVVAIVLLLLNIPSFPWTWVITYFAILITAFFTYSKIKESEASNGDLLARGAAGCVVFAAIVSFLLNGNSGSDHHLLESFSVTAVFTFCKAMAGVIVAIILRRIADNMGGSSS